MASASTVGRPFSWVRRHRLDWVGVSVLVIGLALTASGTWAAWRSDRDNEQRLLRVQTSQAANVVTIAIASIETSLRTVVEAASASPASGEAFTQLVAPYVGPGKTFANASLWRPDSGAPLAAVGGVPVLTAGSADLDTLVRRAATTSTFVVMALPSSTGLRLAYAQASTLAPQYVLYAERIIPANRRVPAESNPAFAELHFATYLGATTDNTALQTTDLPPDQLPLHGLTARESIPFGNLQLTLVTSPSQHLGGWLTGALAWMLLGGGLVLTLLAAIVATVLNQQRIAARIHAVTTESLYVDQRTIAETLQHALIPKTNPDIPTVRIASRYLPGTEGVDVGGDWYSAIRINDDRFGFVVGDVSGRGVEAAAVMARIRFTLRAYLREGHPPHVALQLCNKDLDLQTDGHFATVIVGIADLPSRRVELAAAGHLPPLVRDDRGSRWLRVPIGLPLGIRASGAATDTPFRSAVIHMDAGSTLLAYTDGLVERRDESIDDGLDRLARAVDALDAADPEDLLESLLDQLNPPGHDDIAILAFTWVAEPSALGPSPESVDTVQLSPSHR
ncbi:MAG: serine/threonine-protein phosphatase [Actinobacteria bacterium]|nr:serine/threonine-protein phosphatase [Actinomycetota bacterium]